MPNSDSSKPFEKKTERLDVRLSHEKKQAFNEACENQGDTPSSAVRRFINSYIRRSNRDDMGAAIRGTTKGKGLFVAGGIAALIAAAFIIPKLTKSTSTEPTKEELFAFYDYDLSGIIELGEISHNDDHLHRVLNIDGKPGISLEEFYTNGTMIWSYVEPANTTLLEEVREKTPNGYRHKRSSIVSNFSVDDFPEGTMIPTGDPDKPFLTVDEFKALGKPIWEVQNIDVPPEVARAAMQDAAPPPEDIKNKFVIFDLRDTEKIQVDVLEHTSHGMVSKSIPFMRSVEWVEGEDKPHFVMGTGHDWWKSLQE